MTSTMHLIFHAAYLVCFFIRVTPQTTAEPGPIRVGGVGTAGGRLGGEPNAAMRERRREGTEEDGDATRDLQWELDLTTTEDQPRSLPGVNQAKRVYRSQIQRVLEDARSEGDNSLRRAPRSSPNPVFRYYTLENWQKPILKCCPKKWDYSCRSINVRLPCFSYTSDGEREWCCPMWPNVYAQRCQCSECAVLTDTCVYKGRCRSRYRKTSFIAVCYRNNSWATLRYISQYLPSSCYCKIQH